MADDASFVFYMLGILILIFAGGFLGTQQRYKYTGPYTLRGASSRQKWQWAINLALLESLVLISVGFAIEAGIGTLRPMLNTPLLPIAIASMLLLVELVRSGAARSLDIRKN